MYRDFHENLVSPDATILQTLKIIDTHGVPVGLVHREGILLGTVTDGDIRRGILGGITLDAPVTRIMNASPITAPEGTTDAAALKMMQARMILYLPVIAADGRIIDLKVLKEIQPGAIIATTPVLLMAGGLGTRLRPVTETVPKPMIEVGGQPILESIIERFVEQGFTEIFLSVNYRKEMIQDHFGDGAKWGARIRYVHEDGPRGTAGALALLPERPLRPMIVMNGDILTKINFDQLVKFHDERRAPATMSVREYRFTVPYGVIETDGYYLSRVVEKPEQKFFVNAGVYVIAPDVIDLVPKEGPTDMPDLFAQVLRDSRERNTPRPAVFPLREYWIDIGRIDDLSQARREFNDLFGDGEVG